jgi:hypothetical protein
MRIEEIVAEGDRVVARVTGLSESTLSRLPGNRKCALPRLSQLGRRYLLPGLRSDLIGIKGLTSAGTEQVACPNSL